MQNLLLLLHSRCYTCLVSTSEFSKPSVWSVYRTLAQKTIQIIQISFSYASAGLQTFKMARTGVLTTEGKSPNGINRMGTASVRLLAGL